jgi:Na+-transporting methylmalonyl-CoA/oxaloacetate decarboxylase gamma subunit
MLLVLLVLSFLFLVVGFSQFCPSSAIEQKSKTEKKITTKGRNEKDAKTKGLNLIVLF